MSSVQTLVSICCITFNHEKFIRKCLDSFLVQKTNFEFEILVFDDASHDKTQDIILEYAAQHPKIITYLQQENQFSKNKYGLVDWLFPSAKGKYIALCEGDDYWTDSYKLQKQVDFLEANPNYALHTHVYQILNSQNEISEIKIEIENKSISFAELLNNWNIQTATFLLRSEALEGYKNNDYKAGDVSLVYHLSEKGKIYCSNEVMSVYRVQGQGVTNMDLGKRIEFLESMNKLFLDIISSTTVDETRKAAKRLYIGNLLNLSDHYRMNKRKKTSFLLLLNYLFLRNISMSKMEFRLSVGIIKNYFYA